MLAELRDADGRGLPRYVERELAEYLRCGVLAHGFARVRCQACGDELVVAFSCKGAGSARRARRAAWRTRPRTWSITCCRARRIGSGWSRCPSRCGWCSRAIRRGRAGRAT
ncbi:MAG: transposase zinc-binding domain-containing protein, partial [Deltaproteobacteria bacterium]